MNTSSRLFPKHHLYSICSENQAAIRQAPLFMKKLKALTKIADKLKPEKFKAIFKKHFDETDPEIDYRKVKQELEQSSSLQFVSDMYDGKCQECLSLSEKSLISKLSKSPKKLKYFQKMIDILNH